MSYENFCESPVGTVKELVIETGLLRFVKSSSHRWLIEFSMKNCEAFPYTTFTTVRSEIEASCLFDQYSK